VGSRAGMDAAAKRNNTYPCRPAPSSVTILTELPQSHSWPYRFIISCCLHPFSVPSFHYLPTCTLLISLAILRVLVPPAGGGYEARMALNRSKTGIESRSRHGDRGNSANWAVPRI
jgi:hypothetical protein